MAFILDQIKRIIASLRFGADSWQDFRDRHPAIARDLGAFALVLLLAAVIWALSAASGNPSPFGY